MHAREPIQPPIPTAIIDVVRGADPCGSTGSVIVRRCLTEPRKMADMTESPPLFDTNETKLDDLEDDDEDIFASAVQVSQLASDRSRRESRFREEERQKKKKDCDVLRTAMLRERSAFRL